MIRFLSYLLIASFVLVGCIAPPDEPALNTGNNQVLLAATPTADASPTPVPTATPLGTEDPDEGLIFDELTMQRSGGIAGTTLERKLLGDGTLLENGEQIGAVPAETVVALDNVLDRMGFFRLRSQYGPPEARPDTFSYRITVERSGASRTVTTVDGYVPDSLWQLITTMLELEPSGPSSNVSESPPAAGD